MAKSRHHKRQKRRSAGQRTDARAFLIREVAHFSLRECCINENWKEARLASIYFARNRPGGRVAFAGFVVDLGCLGVKGAFANPAISIPEYENSLSRGVDRQIPCDPAFAVKLIQGACDYAQELGFSPDRDYYYAREIFGGIDPASCPDAIEYGSGGKPSYVAGPYDDVERIMDRLTRKLGPDGFHFVVPLAGQELFDLFDGEDEPEAWNSGTRVRA